MMSKLKSGPAALIIAIIAVILENVLKLDPDEFGDCRSDEFEFGRLPSFVKTIISLVPGLGELFDLIGDKLCFKTGCDPDRVKEMGLCYKRCRPQYKSDGAVLCYKQYPQFENNGRLHTITNITKRITLNTGVPLSRCDPHEDKSGLLCYPKCRSGYNGVGPVCWSSCGGDRDVGALCRHYCKPGYKEVLGVCWQTCPGGYKDTGAFCDTGVHIYGKGCCCVRAYGRSRCCNNCRAGYNDDGCTCRRHHIFTKHSYVPRTYAKHSYGRGWGTPMKCEYGLDNIAGLCYKKCNPGYNMQSLGLCSQVCPPDSRDMGVGCIRDSYNRGIGTIPLKIRMKPRKQM